jgi:spore coat polysaccharide biosynthesis predicted glycosyltransferase SpsG
MHIIFLTECSNAIGLGHFKRCLTLGEEFLTCRDITIEFITSEENEEAQEIAKFSGVPCTYFNESTENLIINLNSLTIFIVDVKTNLFDSLIEKISDSGFKIFGIDDLSHRNEFFQANFSPPAAIPISDSYQQNSRNFIGWEWVPVLTNYKEQQFENHVTKDIFLIFGGSDADNLSLPSCKFFCSIFDDYEIHLVCGPLMDKNSLSEVLKIKGEFSNLTLYLSPAVIQECFRKNALYVTTFGHAYYEMLAFGLNPTLVYRSPAEIAGIMSILSQLGNPQLITKGYLELLNVNQESRKIWDLKFQNQNNNEETIKYLSSMLILGSENIVNKILNLTS